MLSWFVSKATGTPFFIEYTNGKIDTSTNIIINCYSDSSKHRVLPCKYTWYRFINNTHHNINSIRGNTYTCDAGDIGSIIKVQISSLDSQFQGTKILQFGPIRISVNTRNMLQKVCMQQQISVQVKILGQQSQKQVKITFSNNNIIIFEQNKNTQSKFEFNLSNQQHNMQFVLKQHNKITIKFLKPYLKQLKRLKQTLFSQRKQCLSSDTLQLKLSRQMRDLLYLSQKCSLNKRTSIIHLIQLINSPSSPNEISSLLNYINDLQNTINKLTKQIDQFKNKLKNVKIQSNFSNSAVTVMSDKSLYSKYQSLQSQKNQLTKKVKLLEKNNLRTSQKESLPKTNRISKDSIQKYQKLKQKNKKLQNQNNQLLKNLQNYDKIYQQSNSDTLYSDYLDGLSSNNSFKSSSIQFQGDSISRIPLSFSKVTHKSIQKQFKRTRSPLFKRKTQTNIQYCNNQSSLQYNSLKQTQDKISMQLQTFKNKNKILNYQNFKLKSNIDELSHENKHLFKTNDDLQNNIKALIQISKNSQLKKLSLIEQYQRKISQLKDQIDIIQSNQQILNQSKSIESDFGKFKIEENEILKSQNVTLMQENKKLAIICQKYINEAKEVTKLRGEIIRLNKQMTQIKQHSHRIKA